MQDNPELKNLFQEDQTDRMPSEGQVIDWRKVGPRDRAREQRVKEMIDAGRLRTGADYYHAAMVLQHAPAPEDYLLAHELCIIAISKGHEQAKWLAAASEDRFLMNIGRPQRFGTQYRKEGPEGPFRLYKVDPSVKDELRRAFNVPALADAKAQEVKLNDQAKDKKQ